jgi:hypothetical protein
VSEKLRLAFTAKPQSCRASSQLQVIDCDYGFRADHDGVPDDRDGVPYDGGDAFFSTTIALDYAGCRLAFDSLER